MAESGIWHVREVDEANPLAAEQPFRQTFLSHADYSSTNVTRIREAGGIRAHIHREHDEVIVVLEGEGEFRIGSEVRRVRPGDAVVAPAGTVHGPTRNSPAFLFLSVFAPQFDPANPDRVFIEE